MKKIVLFLFLSASAYAQAPNFFYSFLTETLASTDTTVTFTASDTTYVADSSGFYATIWDTRYASASEAYKSGAAEIVYVNSRTGNTFDVERAQLGTAAVNFTNTARRYKISVDAVSPQNAADYFAITQDSIAALRASITSGGVPSNYTAVVYILADTTYADELNNTLFDSTLQATKYTTGVYYLSDFVSGSYLVNGKYALSTNLDYVYDSDGSTTYLVNFAFGESHLIITLHTSAANLTPRDPALEVAIPITITRYAE